MPTQRLFARAIVAKLQGAGHVAYFAGGWVRDLLMGHPSDDIDIATSASVEAIQKLFPKTIPVGVAFGIVIVVEQGHQFEVATFRRDRDYLDGRRPQGFDSATPEEDALRRDFTINGMFYDPMKECLYDYVHGQEDIKKKMIRAIGDPHARFLEDRLRMMRAVRYATRFDFEIEPQTRKAILDHAESLFPSVAIERVWQEFQKMAHFAHFDKALAEMQRLCLLSTIFPALKGISPEEIEKRLACIQHFPQGAPPIAELIELFLNPSLQELLELCAYLKLSKEESQFVRSLHAAFSILQMPDDWQVNLEPVEWAKFYADSDTQICIEIFAARLAPTQKELLLAIHRTRQKALSSFIQRISSKTPIVCADDLQKLGILPGPLMGRLLREAERISVNFQLERKEEILHLLQTSSLWLENNTKRDK